MKTRVRTIVRPDRRCLVRCAGAWTPAAAADAVALAKGLGLPTLAHVDSTETAEQATLFDAGFVTSRRDARTVMHVEHALQALGDRALPAGVTARSAADVDEDALRRLDDELRNDVPGTSGWRSTPADFRAHTFEDPAFDPRTYLVAVDGPSGAHLGLVRIWMNSEGPRLGLLGVRRGWRRRGIGSALLARALAAVLEARGSEVATEFDLVNDASRALAERLGARTVGATIELVYVPETAEAVARGYHEEPSRVG